MSLIFIVVYGTPLPKKFGVVFCATPSRWASGAPNGRFWPLSGSLTVIANMAYRQVFVWLLKPFRWIDFFDFSIVVPTNALCRASVFVVDSPTSWVWRVDQRSTQTLVWHPLLSNMRVGVCWWGRLGVFAWRFWDNLGVLGIICMCSFYL